MNAAVALRTEIDNVSHAPSPNRDAVLARYRALREIATLHHSNVMDFVSKDAIFQSARRLGLAEGKTLILDSIDELTLAFDLTIYTAPVDRSLAVDRYARSARLARGSDEAIVLEAMRQARFAVLSVQRRHPSVGLIVNDPIRETDLWLIDEGLEISAPEGTAFATRYLAVDSFVMTAGVVVPLDRLAFARALASAPLLLRKSPADAIQDRRFAEAVYRGAIEDGTMERVVYRDAGEEA